MLVVTRMNTILDLIKTRTVIDCVTLLSEIRKAEINFPELICRKSMLSLCGKLLADNFIKAVEMELKTEEKSVTSLFLVEPSVSFDMRCWHSIIEEQKIQNFITNKSIQETKENQSSPSALPLPISIEAGELGAHSNQFEDFPKFMKLKLFHEFLYYLIYAYPEDHKKIMISNAVDIWAKDNLKIIESDEITENITNCYSTEISWKMFVPPLNPQRDYKNGWALIRDVIHRIPLILFVKFTRAAQETKELQEYLNHPIKCNYLLHFLAPKLRVSLLQGRKHVFVIQELCKRLCWCGLLQFGPSRTKEVDQTFVYLNRNASLFDTTSSEDGYLEVSEKDYPEIKFQFETPEDVAEYWNQMFHIAINTRINRRGTAIGRAIEFERSGSNAGLRLALKVQSIKSAPLNDSGFIPGDHKGAVGLDKSLMVHLKRNWTRSLEGTKRKHIRTVSKDALTSRSASLSSPRKLKIRKDNATIVKEAAARIKNKSLKSKATINKLSPKSKIIRRNTNVNRKRAMETEDGVDKAALMMMKTMRVTWSELEDKTLILTKVAAKFAFPAEAQSAHYVSQNVFRDILHWRTDQALNKTSKACSRRLQYLIKTKTQVREQIALYIEELRANREFNGKYRNLADRLKSIYPLEDIYNVVKVHMVEIVHRLHQIFFKQFLNREVEICEKAIQYELPKDYSELIKSFTIANPTDSLIVQKYFDPKTIKDAEISMLTYLVHGDVCCSHNRRKQQIEIYMSFPDSHLSAAIAQLKKTNVISVNMKNKNKDKCYLPSSFPQFHLSTRYGGQMLNIHVPFDLYEEYMQAIKTLSSSDGSYQMKNLNCGWLFMLSEMMCSAKIYLSYDRAEKLVMVDPALRMKSQFDKISDNYLMSQNKSSGSKLNKTVKFYVDDSCDETFSFTDDPIEVFFKMRNIYLHTFCILQALSKDEDIHFKNWKVSECGECSLKGCILKEDNSFGASIQNIAKQELSILKAILNNASVTSLSLSSITTQNFLIFYDDAIQKHTSEIEFSDRKDFSAKAMPMWNKLTTRKILEAIVRLATEPRLEDDDWITEYKKISRKTDEDGLEDEDMDNIKHLKMFHQLKDLNLNQRTADSFVVNLSTIHVNLDQEAGDQTSFKGYKINTHLVPFTEEKRNDIIDHILNEARYKEEDLEVKDIFEELSTIGITGPLEIIQISEMCSFIQAKSQMGATTEDLLEVFADKHRLQKQIEILIKLKIIFRVGVVESKFIHKEFLRFWLIESYFTTRITNDTQTEKNEKQQCGKESEGEPTAKKIRFDEIAGTSANKSMDNSETKKNEQQKICTRIRFRPAPWIRVDGSINREVLDKWLGTILNHLSINPSMMLTDLCGRFNVLSPFHIRYSCEILQMIGSVQLKTITEPQVDLFSTNTESIVGEFLIFKHLVTR